MEKRTEYILRVPGEKIKVSLPIDIGLDTRKVILDTLKAIQNKKYKVEALEKLEELLGGMNALIKHLKKDNRYDPALEKILRKIMGEYLERGIDIGSSYANAPENLLYIVQPAKIDVKKRLDKVLPDKKWLSEYVIYCFTLGAQAYETGMIVSALVRLDQEEQYMKQLKKESLDYFQ